MVFNKDQPELGDLLEIRRNLGYSHWGVYAGGGNIIHLTFNVSPCDGIFCVFKRFLSKSVVKCDKQDDVAGTCDVTVNNSLDGQLQAKVKEEIVKFAEKCLGKEGYGILFGNCETFANMCRYGNPVSFQAVNLVKILFALDAGIVVGKLTSFLKYKIGYFGATTIGLTAGTATAGVTLCLTMTLPFLEELVIKLVTEASKQVLLTDRQSANNYRQGVGVASNIVFTVNIGYIFYNVYQVVTSETFKTIFNWLRESFSDFLSGLYNLVIRSVSRLMSAPQ